MHQITSQIFGWALIGTLFIFAEKSQAQTTVSSELTIQMLKADSVYALGDWVLPNSIKVFHSDSPMSDLHWNFNESTGEWSIKPGFREQYEGISVRIEFEAYPLVLRRFYQNNEELELDSAYLDVSNDSLSRELIEQSREDSFGDSDLQQSGSLSRGIIVGTNQDFALESGLQFELTGNITDDVSINATLTDRSIPIQPDGTTQNLREFDRVFIQLQSPGTTVEMGDVDVSFEQSTFARLNRRLQGAAGYTSTRYGDYNGAVSVVRGTYKSLNFQGQDGVQGPYRLTGREGEEFVIILAGTERVYINGQRVERGEENEYIIDYGLGEVYFTNNLLIKDETRIVVEYEYIDQNFNRTLVAAEAGDELFDGRLKIGASVIRQADGDELLSQQTLTESDINTLRSVGDDLDQAVVSGATIDEGDDNNIRYAEIDTTVNGQTFSIYKNIPGSEQAVYTVRFTNVGEGNGSYRRVGGAVNGLLYEWVGPGQGEYEPFRQLPAPEEQQMVAFNSSFDVSDHIELYGEWALSSFDQNRFSDLDDEDNNDISYLSGFRISDLSSAIGGINVSAYRRYTGGNFRFFERTREVEFNRKWNIQRDVLSREAINEASLEIAPTIYTRVGGEYGFIDRADFRGYRQASSFSSDEPGILSVNYQQDLVLSEDEVLTQNGRWFRQRGRVGKDIGAGFSPYISFEQERRTQRDHQTDSLLQNSFSFYEAGPGINWQKGAFEAGAAVFYRLEKAVLNNRLKRQATAIEQQLQLSFTPNEYFRTRNEFAIRSKDFTREFELEGGRNRKALLIRSVTDYQTKKENWSGQLFYETNTERRAILQEAYVEVGPELGQYVWVDENEDGVQQIDEFFPELSPNEGTFVRQYIPSDQLLPVIDLNVRLRNEIKPFDLFNPSDDNGLLKNITVRSRIQISENSTTENLADIYLLRLNEFRNDSTTIEGRLFWEKEADLLPDFQRTDVTIGYNQNKNLNQRSTDSQELYSDLAYVNTSYNITERVRISADLTRSENSSQSSRLASRNFEIISKTVTPGVEATINRSWQTSFSFTYSSKEDRFPAEPVSARVLKLSNSNRAFLFRKMQANTRLEIRNTSVRGNSSSLGTYELTEGTGRGTNLIWSASGNYRASDLIRISFNYDGRTVHDRPDVHTFRLVVSAVF